MKRTGSYIAAIPSLWMASSAWALDFPVTFSSDCNAAHQNAVWNAVARGKFVTHRPEFQSCVLNKTFRPCVGDPSAQIADGWAAAIQGNPVEITLCQPLSGLQGLTLQHLGLFHTQTVRMQLSGSL